MTLHESTQPELEPPDMKTALTSPPATIALSDAEIVAGRIRADFTARYGVEGRMVWVDDEVLSELEKSWVGIVSGGVAEDGRDVKELTS